MHFNTFSRALCTLALFIALITATVSPAVAYLTDAGIHPPPTTGAYPYYSTFGLMGPDRSGFPAKGQTFVDPVFGSTIRRLTNELGLPSTSDIYAKNGFWNSDGTRMYHNTAAARTIIDATTGAVVRTDVPGDTEASFAPDNPDVFYHWSGASLMKYSVASGTSSLVKTFPGTLESLGGSVDWIDNSGRYMVLNIAGRARVWDKQSDVLYAGSLPTDVGTGWIGISPDGKYVVTAADDKSHVSYAINHATRTVNTTGVMFWNLCGDHSDLVSASNGKTYLVGFECDTDPGIWAVDVSIPQTADNVAKQHADNRKLFTTAWTDGGHISGVSRGAMQDWAYVSVESDDDSFTSGVSGWRPYKQEIVMANVVTGEVRRLAHHRSRGLETGSYYYQPRVSASWDGMRVAWASNFGLGAPEYADIYSITTGTTPPPSTSLAVSITNPKGAATVSGTTTVTISATGGTSYTYTLKRDGVVIYSGTNPTFSWNTKTTTNGSHTLVATVTAPGGKSGNAKRTVTVANTA